MELLANITEKKDMLVPLSACLLGRDNFAP